MSTKNDKNGWKNVNKPALNLHEYLGAMCILFVTLVIARVTYDMFILHGGYTTLGMLATVFLSLYILTGEQS